MTQAITFARSAIALAVCAAFAAGAQEKKEEEKTNPIETHGSVEVGVGATSGDPSDRAFFGQYNGLRNQDLFGIANFDYRRLDTSTGSWLDVVGSNLGLQTREIGVLWTRQGDWRVRGAYGELRRVDPYTVNTGVTGAGTVTPTANYLVGGPRSGGDYDPATKRKAFELAGSKWFAGQYQLEANVTSEKKNGTQLWGIGNVCPGTVASGCVSTANTTAGFGVLYFPQPIDYDHTQVEARVNYAGSNLQLSGGYYGSFFSNNNGAVTPGVPSILNNAVGLPLPSTPVVPGAPGVQGYLNQAVALAPDNQHNSIDLAGSYTFSPIIRTNFKFAYAKTRQDHDFASMGLAGAPAGVGNLDGEVTHTLSQIRVIANPIAKLSLVGEYRYSNQEDETPIVPYGLVGTTVYSNQRVSREVNDAKLEATYRFPWAIQGTAGLGWRSIDRGSYTTSASYTGISALREETDETSWWIQVRRSMTETLSGLVSYTGSSRDGSNWLAPATGGVGLVPVGDPLAQLGANAIYMPTLADRDRSKLRLLLNWMATDALSVQFAIDWGKDEYDAPTQFALQETKFDLYTLDVNYALSDAWNINGYVSTGKQTLNQARPQGYILAFEDKSFNAGIGFTGKASEKLRLGGTLSYISNEDKYAQALGAGAAPGTPQLLAVTGGLPDILYRRTELRLFGTYALRERSTLRIDAAYQRLTYDDWGFAYGGTPFLYSDNSTVFLQPDQNVGYVGISYIYSLK